VYAYPDADIGLKMLLQIFFFIMPMKSSNLSLTSPGFTAYSSNLLISIISLKNGLDSKTKASFSVIGPP
jgi:hypothetical protein